MSEQQDFCDAFDDALFDCVDNGTPKRLTVNFVNGKYPVTVDIYPQGGTMKKFNDIILSSVKEKTGIDIAEKLK